MADSTRNRAKGCLVGLAVGDALGQPAEGKDPAEIRRRWGRIEGFTTETPESSDDTEFALFSGQVLLRYGVQITSDDVAREWRHQLVRQGGPFRGAGFSEMAAIENLRRGIDPPLSGCHFHSWSDGLAMRVAPLAIAANGNVALATKLAAVDGCVSHAGEGLYSGMAVAAAITVALYSRPSRRAVERLAVAALAAVPAESWTARSIGLGVSIGQQARDVWSALDLLHDNLAVTYYPWVDLGPEAVGLAFGLVCAAQGDFSQTVLGACNLGRDADTVAAIGGAIVGSLIGYENIPPEWRNVVREARGSCIRCVAGTDLPSLAEDLVRLGEGAAC